MLVGCLVLAACGSSNVASTTSSPPPTPSTGDIVIHVCQSDPSAHVYHPDRLQILAPCVTVDGTIASITAEADGDYHVRLRLDPGQTCEGMPCLNARNVSGQQGDLLLEPVCMHPITQADAEPACSGYANPMVLPPVGAHVAAMGPFVLDLDHGWNEIHPVDSIVISDAG